MSFCESLNLSATSKVKVVSVIGKTGEGKSHLMNATFFEGKNVFATSSQQKASTIGCWAAYDSLHQVLLLDTEGLLNNNKQPIRLLLKVNFYFIFFFKSLENKFIWNIFSINI